jgi:hypothetical protein
MCAKAADIRTSSQWLKLRFGVSDYKRVPRLFHNTLNAGNGKKVFEKDVSQNNAAMDRELSISELFSRTFEIAKQHYTRVLPIFVGFGIFSTIVATLFTYAGPSSISLPSVSNITSAQLAATMSSIFAYIGYTLANYFVTWNILYFAAGLGIGRMNRSFAASQEPLKYSSLALATLLSVVIIEAGLFLILVGALIFAIMLYLVLTAVVIEGKSGVSAIGRSRQLVSGRWGKTFILLVGIQIVVAIVSNLIGAIAGLPFSGELSTIAAVVATNFVMALSFPLVSASMLVLYYSNRATQTTVLRGPTSPYSDMKPEPLPGFPTAQNYNNFCPKCGSSVSREEKFCHNCGTQLQS